MMGGEEYAEGCIMVCACMAASEAHFFVLNKDVTADESSRMSFEVYRAILFAQIQLNASEAMWQHVTLRTDNDLNHTLKAAKDCLGQRSGMLCNDQVNHLMTIQTIQHVSLAEAETEGESP